MDLPEGAQRNAIGKAKDELKQGLEMIAARQKRIKVADRSEYGWATVDEYEQNQLVADKEDAKRLEKAEKLAGSKAAKWKKVTSISRSDAGGDNKVGQWSQLGDSLFQAQLTVVSPQLRRYSHTDRGY